MAKRTDLPKIYPETSPSIFNGSFWGGVALAAVPLLLAASSLYPAAVPVAESIVLNSESLFTTIFQGIGSSVHLHLPSITGALGSISATGLGLAAAGMAGVGLIGGAIGKRGQVQDVQNGKHVNTPTFFNSKLVSSLGASLLVGSVAMGIAAAFGAPAMAVAGMGVIFGISGAVNTVLAGFDGKEQMQNELDMANDLQVQMMRERQQSRGLSRGRSVGQQRGIGQKQAPYVNSVNAQEMAALNARMSGGNQPREFARDITEKREAAAAALEEQQQQQPT